jgi:O-acetyl-ADP-ribose deacetylase (regulator of RNase III)
MGALDIKGLYYITHIDNLPSILRLGILSHKLVEEEGFSYTRIYDKGIVEARKDKLAPDGKSLWDFANLYFNARNPMLYRVKHEKSLDDIAIVCVSPTILQRPDIFITTGNARASQSAILPKDEGIRKLPKIKREFDIVWWKPEDGSKRKIMAECLVPDLVPAEYIQAIYVASHKIREKIEAMLRPSRISVIPEPNMFFLPLWRSRLTQNLFLVEGDMFFSTMQTFTISVNCVGVMGKGLASRAKYQFPDVYVVYQDVCRKRKLKMGKPYLIKRETSLDYELADEPSSLSNANLEKWFLLFPTKNHWREKSDITAIEQGLQWVQDNYKKQGIKSLAIPALGCGLGRLEWRDVGPLLCKYLSTLDIQVAIYLPREKKISEELLSKDFLLR